jgi:lactate 2-monooxygenase
MEGEPLANRSFQTGRQLELYFGRRRDACLPEGQAGQELPLSVEQLEQVARNKLGEAAYDWVAGCAGSQATARANLAAFEQWRLVPRMLVDVSHRDLSIELFGQRMPAPVLLAPIGVQRVAHPEGELATARAAAAVGLTMAVSTVSSYRLEEVAAASGNGPRWFQLYWPKDPELALSLVKRAEAAGYSALLVTLDTRTLGWRERNLELGFLPFSFGEGLANYVTDPVFRASLPPGHQDDPQAAFRRYLEVFSDLAHTWDDLELLRRNTALPLLVKGIQHPDDARRALDAGADGLVVSNHGGRQVDGAIGSLEALPAVVDAVGGAVPVLFDSGIRRAADCVKALALGASAVLLGRPYMWALTVAGEAGVRELLWNLLAELDVTLSLCGKRCVAELSRDDLVHGSSFGLGPAAAAWPAARAASQSGGGLSADGSAGAHDGAPSRRRPAAPHFPPADAPRGPH